MSTQWRCAICEAVNDGGDTCVACGAKVTHTVVQATPAQEPAAPEVPVRDELATEIPVRELPRRRYEVDTPDDGAYDIYDYFDVVPGAGTGAADDRYERIDTRPRVRVYGCCLPLCLGMSVVFVSAVTALGNLLIRAL